MRRALLAWETGAGRGHLLSLKAVAEAIGDRFHFDAALCQMHNADILRPLCDEMVRGPSFVRDRDARIAAGNPERATFGEYMGDMGFRREEFLAERFAYWVNLIRTRGYELVIADLAPLALMAARSLGVRTVTVGVGWFVPPAHMDVYPIIRDEYRTLIHDEAAMVETVNRAGAPFGIQPIARLPEVFACDEQLVCTLPMFDPYVEARREPLLPPVTSLPSIRAAAGDAIHAYFSTTELDDPQIVEALCSFGCTTRLFAPGLKPQMAAAIAARGVEVLPGPIEPDEIARRTRLILHSGQHGIMSMAIAAGIPQVALPQHIEQEYNAVRAAEAGILRHVPAGERSAAALRAVVAEARGDTAMWMRAQELSRDLEPVFRLNLRRLVRRRLMMI